MNFKLVYNDEHPDEEMRGKEVLISPNDSVAMLSTGEYVLLSSHGYCEYSAISILEVIQNFDVIWSE